MSSGNSFPDDILLHATLERERAVQRLRERARSEMLHGREVMRMRELIDDFEDFSFTQQADLRRTNAYGMRMAEQRRIEAIAHSERFALKQKHEEEMYNRQQQEEENQIKAALKSAREDMQQNAVAAARENMQQNAMAAVSFNHNVHGFSQATRNRILLHEQGLRERALVSAHAEKMRLDALKKKHDAYTMNHLL